MVCEQKGSGIQTLMISIVGSWLIRCDILQKQKQETEMWMTEKTRLQNEVSSLSAQLHGLGKTKL